MKQTEKFIVIRNLETGNYLVSYKSNEGAFAYTANWSEYLQDASTGTLKTHEKQGDQFQKVAEALGGELLIVNATYELETLNGNKPKDIAEEIEKAKRKHFENFLRGLLADDDEED